MNNLVSFNDFKKYKMNEEFGGKGNVSGGYEFFEDSKKTFLGGIFHKLGSYVKQQINKQILRNLAHRYNQELLAGVLKYSQDKSLIISKEFKLFILNKETEKYDIEVKVGEDNKVDVNKEIITVADSKALADSEYDLSINKKIVVKDGKITEIKEEKKEEEKKDEKIEGDYLFTFGDEEVKVFIPNKEIKVENSIYGYDSDGNSGKTLENGEYKYETKKITIDNSKITKVEEETKEEQKEEVKEAEFVEFNAKWIKFERSVFRTVEQKLFINEVKVNNDVFFKNEKEDKLIKISIAKLFHISNEDKNINSIIDVNETGKIINVITEKSLTVFIDDKTLKFVDIIKNTKDEDKLTTVLLNEKQHIYSKVLTMLKLAEFLKLTNEGHNKLNKFKNTVSRNFKNEYISNIIRSSMGNKESLLKFVNDLIINDDKKISIRNFESINILNEKVSLFENKLKKTKLSGDLKKDLNSSYSEINLENLDLNNVEITEEVRNNITNYVNVSNIVGIQIRAEQLYETDKNDDKTNQFMKRYWETKIQDVKSQYDKYVNVDKLDPIKLRIKLDNVRKGSSEDGYDKKFVKPSGDYMKNINSNINESKNIFEYILKNIDNLKCVEHTNKTSSSDYYLLNIEFGEGLYSFLCNGGDFGEGTFYNYKILAIIDFVKLMSFIKDKNSKISFDNLLECTGKKISSDSKFSSMIKYFGFKFSPNDKIENNYIFGNFILTNSTRTNHKPTTMKVSTCLVYIKDKSELLNKDSQLSDEDITKLDSEINIIFVKQGLVRGIKENAENMLYDMKFASLYKIPDYSSNLFRKLIDEKINNKSRFFNKNVRLFHYINYFTNYNKKIK